MSQSVSDTRGLPSATRSSLRAVAALVLREMSTRYGRTPGGYLWAILEPLGMIIMNRPGFTGGQNSRRIARYGTESKEDLEAVFT